MIAEPYIGHKKAQQIMKLAKPEQYMDKCGWCFYHNEKELDEAGESVGLGLFCDPDHKMCSVFSVCERHKQSIDKEWIEL